MIGADKSRAYMYGWAGNDTFWSRDATLGGTQTLDVVYPSAASDIDAVLQDNGF